MANKMNKILMSPDKDVTKTSGANGVLSRLFRQMVLDLGIGPSQFGSLLQDYILDARHGVPNNRKDQTSQRGNLTKEFSRPQMTWKVFCKALRFLQVLKIDIIIKAHHENGMTTIHSTAVDFGRRIDLNRFDKELEQTEEKEAVQLVEFLTPNNLE